MRLVGITSMRNLLPLGTGWPGRAATGDGSILTVHVVRLPEDHCHAESTKETAGLKTKEDPKSL